MPKEPVTIAVGGVASPDHPTADKAGTFNYVIDQGHVFFHGKPIPPGIYAVVVTAPGGLRADTSFQVYSYDSRAGAPGGAGKPAAVAARRRAAGRRNSRVHHRSS